MTGHLVRHAMTSAQEWGLVTPIMLGALAALSSCQSDQDNMSERARQLLERQLIDPSSMQLRDVRAGRVERNHPTVCGEVNAKNTMGGYAGFRPFLISDDKAMLAEPGSESSLGYSIWRSRWAAACGTSEEVAEAKRLGEAWVSRTERETEEIIKQQHEAEARYREITR